MVSFRAELPELADAYEQLQRFDATVEAALEDARREVARVHASWTGQAAEEQRAVAARWREGAELMHQGLREMHHVLAIAYRNYSAAIESNTRMWGSQ